MRTRWIVALVLAVTGLVWISQGTGLLGGSSFMDGDVRWAIAGAGLVILAALLAWSAFRSRTRV